MKADLFGELQSGKENGKGHHTLIEGINQGWNSQSDVNVAFGVCDILVHLHDHVILNRP